MKPERTNGCTSDTSLDLEIEAILSVEPSPDFVSRVRARIGDAPAPGWMTEWTMGWTSLAAGTVVVAVVVAVAISRPHDIVQQESLGTTAVRSMRADTPAGDVPASPKLNSVKPRKSGRTRVTNAAFREPQMLINPRETEAVRHFLANPQPERVELSLVTIEPQPLPEFEFTPLPIFDPMAVLQGDFK